MKKNTFHRIVQKERHNFSWTEVISLWYRRVTWTGELIYNLAVEFWWPISDFYISKETMPACRHALLACVCSLDTGILWRMELQIKSNEIDGNFKCCPPSLPFLYYVKCKKSNCILCFMAMIYKVNVAHSGKCFHWDTKSKL